jgi:transposase, IS30 family
VQRGFDEKGAIWDTDESSGKKGSSMAYYQITPEERYTLATLRKQTPRLSGAAMAALLGRHRSTIMREFRRNSARYDGAYRPSVAQERTNGRRSRSRRNSRFSKANWTLIERLLGHLLSPEQISGRLREEGVLKISHETIYQHIWNDKRRGGHLWLFLRQRLRYRKRYGRYEKRGRVDGKRHISERPRAAEKRSRVGHWEMDTVLGTGDQHCVVSLVERATGTLLLGKVRSRKASHVTAKLIELIQAHPGLFKTITADNGTEFHSYGEVEAATDVTIYFATPYHSWERGSNENTNGLIRQYLPKRTSMKTVTQIRCNAIAGALNNRPRKRYRFRTPLEQLRKTIPLDLRYAAPTVGVAVQTRT